MGAVATAKTRTCAKCGAALESASSPDLGCMVCMLQLASAKSPAAFDRDSPLEQFGQYVIEKREDGRAWELGRGAMGVTYRATDSILQRSVALKIISLDHAPEAATARERFLREARAAAALRHPNIATVHQFGIHEESGQCFYAMELIEGETLEERVRRKGPCDVPMTIAIARQVANALLAAETRGLVHRDIKPGNLMMIDGGDETDFTIKVIDFGVAKALAATPNTRELTHGGFVGTPAFASPEQFTDAPVDVRSDIYSLGATLWYLLTGHMPFGDRVVKGSDERPAVVRPPIEQLKAAGIPPRFSSLLVAMLAIEPAARPGVNELSTKLEATQRPKRAARLLGIAAVLALAILAAYFGAAFHTSPNSSVAASEKSIAVLPFENSSDEKANAYFVSGIHDDLLVNLSKIANLKVISRDSVMEYRGTARDLREIGTALGANAVLEGKVRRERDRAHVNVQLIKAADGSQIWAENFEGPITDEFELESKLALQIASALKARVSAAETARVRNVPTKNAEAYRCFVEARSMYADYRKSRPDLDKAEQLYEKAIVLDPKFALGFAHLAQLENVYFEMYDHTPERREKSRAAAREALRLQPELPDAHIALGQDYWRAGVETGEIDYEKALAEFALAQRSLPNDPDIYGSIGRIQRHQGKWVKSTENLKKAAALDPNSLERWHRLFANYEFTHQYPKAAEALDRVIALAPPTSRWRYLLHRAHLRLYWKGTLDDMAQLPAPPPDDADGAHTEEMACLKIDLREFAEAEKIVMSDPREVFAWGKWVGAPKSFVLAQIYALMDDKVRAVAACETALPKLEAAVNAHPRDTSQRMDLAETYARLSRKEDALREARTAAETIPESKDAWLGIEVQTGLARIYFLVGEIDSALPIIRHSLDTPGGLYRNELRVDPFWDGLRGDSRFRQILAEAREPTQID